MVLRLYQYKPVVELALVLLSFKRPLLSVDVMVGMCDSVERYPNPANFTPPMLTSLFYAARCRAGCGNCLCHEQC